MGRDRSRRPPAGLDRRLFQRAGRGLAKIAGRRTIGHCHNWLRVWSPVSIESKWDSRFLILARFLDATGSTSLENAKSFGAPATPMEIRHGQFHSRIGCD